MELNSAEQSPSHISLHHTAANELLNKWAACFPLMLITGCALRLHRFQRLFNSCTELGVCGMIFWWKSTTVGTGRQLGLDSKASESDREQHRGWLWLPAAQEINIKEAFHCPLLQIFSFARGILGTCHTHEFSFNSKGPTFIPAFGISLEFRHFNNHLIQGKRNYLFYFFSFLTAVKPF